MTILSKNIEIVLPLHNFYTAVRPFMVQNMTLPMSAKMLDMLTVMPAEIIFEPERVLKYFEPADEYQGISISIERSSVVTLKIYIILYKSGRSEYGFEITDHYKNRDFWFEIYKRWGGKYPGCGAIKYNKNS